ncbi:MAG: CrcB family protein [Phycisphaerales bacterium]|nr:CrcB family protein [Phycisphaerales bacterium]
MIKLLLVFLGGGIGSVGRYGVGQLVARYTPRDLEPPHWLNLYPMATMLVNLLGCAAIGIAWAWVVARSGGQPSSAMVFLIVGVLGGFTTFSSFGWETFELLQNERIGLAAAYVLMSVTLGILGVFGGYTIGSSVFDQGSVA